MSWKNHYSKLVYLGSIIECFLCNQVSGNMMEMVVIRRMDCLLMKNSEFMFLQFTLEILCGDELKLNRTTFTELVCLFPRLMGKTDKTDGNTWK